MPVRREVLVLQKAEWFRIGVLANDIACQAGENVQQIDDLPRALTFLEARDHLVNDGLDARLEAGQGSFGEVMCKHSSSNSMELVIRGDQKRIFEAKHSH